MSDKKALIFLISDSRGVPVLVHPFGETVDLRTEDNIEGRYGADPEVDAMVLVRNLLYARIDREVQEWSSEKHFFPRFIASLVVFFIVFFVMAWMIRDVIPLVDELLAATGASVATYFIIGRRKLVSKPVLEQKIILKKRVDTIRFNQSNVITVLEKIFRTINDSDGPISATDISEDYREIRELLADPVCKQEVEQLSEALSLPAARKRRLKMRIANNPLAEARGTEENLYVLTLSLLMGVNLPDSFQTV